MNSFALLIPVFIIYITIVYWVLKHSKFKLVWASNNQQTISPQNNRLTFFIKRVLDVFLIFYISIIIAWLPILVVMGLSQSINPTWGIDITAFASFKLDLNELSNIKFSGLRNPEIRGKTLLNIDTSNLFAWYLFAVTQLIAAIAALFGLIQIRAIVISLKNGLSFSTDNANRIKKLGIVIIAWCIVNPFVQYFGWGAVINEISFSSAGIKLYPAFQVNGGALFTGMMMIQLSGMLQEAATISKDQELTV